VRGDSSCRRPRIGGGLPTAAPCPTGEARLTPGFALKAKWVVHAVGPVWRGGGAGEEELLGACYRNAIGLAERAGARTIAFPAVSTGIYGFPVARAAPLAARASLDAWAEHPGIEGVLFACFSEEDRSAYALAAERARAPT